MQLYLVRHAIAHDQDPQEWPDDRLRPLTERGVKRFRKAARGIRSLVPGVDLLLSSELTRAWQTAELLEGRADWPKPIAFAPLEPGHSADEIVRALGEYVDRASIALVGHEPGLHRLVSFLLTGDEGAVDLTFRKGGMACLDLHTVPGPSSATLQWLVTPKQLRHLE
ncbi:MAG: phosphohistidine phosphatase [Chloroflexota bacterium]|jgi:phosphohistidine phosphatase|nr:phosphohistidine phosphatase [Chloroflexota bacterium]